MMNSHSRFGRAFATVALASMAAGCNNVLDVKPETFSGTTNYYQTPDQMDRAIFGAYSFLQPLYGAGATGPMWSIAEMRSDNTTYEQNQSDRSQVLTESIDDFMTTPDNTGVSNLWNTSYSGILQANVVLDRIGAVPYSDQAAKDRIIAEAKWLRALYYYNLVRVFGDVPLRLHETQSYDGAFTAQRTPADSVYAVIIADLKDAIPKLPARSALPAAQAGRATQGAASMLLADVYMTRKNWQEAVNVLQSVVGMGYTLAATYDRAFDPAFKNGPESIYEVQWAEAVVNESSNFLQRFIPNTSGRNLTFGTSDVAGSVGSGWNIPTKDMLRAYEPGDVRRNASNGYWVSTANRPEVDVVFNDTIPYVKKYYHQYSTAGRTNDDFPLFRYAETLLDYAETLNELNRTSEAYTYINQVRSRAGLPALTAGLSQAQFRDAVFREERVELAFEDKRWFQLLRTGRAIAVMTAQGADIKSYAGARRPSVAYQITPQMLLFPLPVREITNNGFSQNPGY
jgi:starch-binding outer membrane protein, SusD/RagB family